MNKKYAIGLGTGILAFSLLVTGGSALAMSKSEHSKAHGAKKPALSGTVTAVSGNILTITAKNNSTYTIDASAAKINKVSVQNGAKPALTQISISNIAVNDSVVAFGTLSGNLLTATQIIDGFVGGHSGHFMGKPTVSGKVIAINGNAITITTRNNKNYTVNAQSATVHGRKFQTLNLSDIKVGDSISARGTLSGSNLSAVTIVDRGQMSVSQAAASAAH